MDDPEILHRIETLVADEHSLLQRRAAGDLEAADHERLQQIETNLDQCWDLSAPAPRPARDRQRP